MAHHHHHHHSSQDGNIRLAFFLNLSFTIIEIIGGYLTNSVAILSDALHDLGDSFSLGLAWYLERFSTKKETAQFSYGYRRLSLLGALINTLILIVGSTFILVEAIPRLFAPEETNATGMLALALLGILVNGIAAYRVSGNSGLNAKVVSWHLFEDLLGWVVVLIGSLIMMFVDAPIIDPLLSVGITIYVIWNVLKYLRQTAKIFLQAVPDGVDLSLLEANIAAIAPVQSVHHMHLWSLDGDENVLTAHVVLPPNTDRCTILNVKKQAHAFALEVNVAHITIEVELEDEDCLMAENHADCGDDHTH